MIHLPSIYIHLPSIYHPFTHHYTIIMNHSPAIFMFTAGGPTCPRSTESERKAMRPAMAPARRALVACAVAWIIWIIWINGGLMGFNGD
jgi:hypothetical protein